MSDYKIPAQTRIGHVHLKVSDLQQSLDFYCGLLVLKKCSYMAIRRLLYRPGLSSSYWPKHLAKQGAPPAPNMRRVYFITAILYPERKDLAQILQR